MSRLFVKVCGVTTPRDACAAVEAGADAVGLNFYPPSPRCLTLKQADSIVAALPPFVWKVGVFVNAPLAAVERARQTLGLDAVQLHGDEDERYARQVHGRVLKALHVAKVPVDREAKQFSALEALVLDAAQPGFGGGGLRFDWALARSVAKRYPVLLAGGLTSANVARAVATVRPFGVDVASGVESAPGIKSSRKMRAFVRAARSQS